MIMLINITIIINMDNMNDFSNDNIISFLLNQFPKDTPLGKNIERYTESSSNNTTSLEPPKPELSFVEKVLDFLKKYWFFFFVFFLILLFILRKRVSKK
jgi:hypothetical protein